MCQRGQAVVRELFEAFGDTRLRGLVAWLPMLPADNAPAALARSALLDDKRITKAWDAERKIGDLFAQLLGLRGTAWDVYLLYPPGPRWNAERPPKPAFWMHQLPEVVGANRTLFLDPDKLAEELRRQLDAATAG